MERMERMERQQSIGPDEAPEVGEATEVKAALPAGQEDVAAAPDGTADPDPGGGPPDGTARGSSPAARAERRQPNAGSAHSRSVGIHRRAPVPKGAS